MIKTNCNLLVIFGATGDLARRKLFPAINDIISSKKLPKNTYLLGCGRKKIDNNIFNDLDTSLKNKSTYLNLRWIAYIGQIIAILLVKFLLEYNFSYFECISIIVISIFLNLHLQFKIKDNQLNNFTSTIYLSYDIFQLGILLFFTGGITNPFIFLIIIPAVFSSQYLHFLSSIILVLFIIIILMVLSFFYYDLPHPG